MLRSEMAKRITMIDDQASSAAVRQSYNAQTHVRDIATNSHYKNLSLFRHVVKSACDEFMSQHQGAINIDLFMLTTSVSSPMGPGSDSEPLPITFGKHPAFLTDSSQFGFEPLVMNGLDSVYCYLPSLRGEEPDDRHLNQFYHCELEMAGGLDEVMQVVEQYVRYMAAAFLQSPNLLKSLSKNSQASISALTELANLEKFKVMTFDDACDLLIESGFSQFVNTTDHGRDISSDGEKKLCALLETTVPIWLTHYDRDRVPFYQKPDPENPDKVLCADLIFPPLLDDSFGGEIVGAGQRQDSTSETQASLERQNVDAAPYEWYINLRDIDGYAVTSGFGLGIERFIAWALCYGAIRDTILYPRELNKKVSP